MSTYPGETPEFGFEKEYDHALLADIVLWPLVDRGWGGDWRNCTFVGNELHLSKRGIGSEGLIDVHLSAFAETGYDDDAQETMLPLSTVKFAVHQHVSGLRRQTMITDARADHDKKHPEADESDEDDSIFRPVTIRDFKKDDDLQPRRISSYQIDTDHELEISAEHLITDAESEQIWRQVISAGSSDRDYDEDDIGTDGETEFIQAEAVVLGERDLMIIESGLIVFGAPESLLEALQKVRQVPLD